MNRRGFLQLAAGAAAALAFDPERALWVPGRKLISVPAVPKIEVAYHLQIDPVTGGVAVERWMVYDQRRSVMHFNETHYMNYIPPMQVHPPPAPHLPLRVRHNLAGSLGVAPADLVLA